MSVHFTEPGWTDYLHWQGNDLKVLVKISELIEEIRRDPFQGKGKPEPLKGNWQGWWSRRITGEHRLVYAVGGKGDSRYVLIAQCRDHY